MILDHEVVEINRGISHVIVDHEVVEIKPRDSLYDFGPRGGRNKIEEFPL